MKMIMFILFALPQAVQLNSQTTPTFMKTIEVTGEARQSIDPDEIIFTISFEEYWKEEFEGKKYEDYKTKIEIESIEQSLIAELTSLNIGMDKITLKETGNYWRQHGKDFLVSKSIDISLGNFEKANEISNMIKTRGVRNMHVSELKHKDLEKFKLQIKAKAVQAAKEKAILMASSLDKQIVDIVTIVEIDENMNTIPRPQPMAYSRAASMDEGMAGVNYENFRKLEIKASVRAVFEMK